MGTKKTLYTCGDSFLSVDLPNKGVTSFLELYAERKNFEHHSLSRAGATCFTIRLQIEHAIRSRADYVVVGCTSSDRLDVPLDVDDTQPWFVLEDIAYQGYGCASEHEIQPHSSHVVSDTVFNHLNNRHYPLPESTKISIKHWLAGLHNPSLKRQENYFVISDGLRKLKDYNIPFVYVPHGLGHMDWTWVERVWPADILPCSMPDGPYDYNMTVTHNGQIWHEKFCDILMSITQDWA